MGENVLAVLGVAAIAAAVGGLSGQWWWSVLVVGLALVAAAYAAHTYNTAVVELAAPPVAEPDAPPRPASAPAPRPMRSVK